MDDAAGAGRCLNCGAPLHGSFCATCGQRAVPPDPTVRELAGDAWQEMTGYDGRIMATIRGLLSPGLLTREYLAGRRAHYLPPLRVYLIVSVIYFVVAAAAPNTDGNSDGPGGLRINIEDKNGAQLSAEDRAQLLADLEESPWFLRPIVRALVEDPAAFRARVFTIMPRVFFGLLPVFAAIVALFYRGRPFPVSLVFAVHLHAFAFVVFTLTEAAKFSGSTAFAVSVAGLVAVFFTAYALRALKAVFGGSWAATLAKAAAIGVVYVILSIPAMMIIVVWASFA